MLCFQFRFVVVCFENDSLTFNQLFVPEASILPSTDELCAEQHRGKATL